MLYITAVVKVNHQLLKKIKNLSNLDDFRFHHRDEQPHITTGHFTVYFISGVASLPLLKVNRSEGFSPR